MTGRRAMQARKTPNGPAPTPELRYAFGPRMVVAWQHAWDSMDAIDYRDGTEIAEAAAEASGVKPVSVLNVLHRMAKAGWLRTELREVKTTMRRYGHEYAATRWRAHFRIALGEAGTEAFDRIER